MSESPGITGGVYPPRFDRPAARRRRGAASVLLRRLARLEELRKVIERLGLRGGDPALPAAGVTAGDPVLDHRRRVVRILAVRIRAVPGEVGDGHGGFGFTRILR